MRIRTKILATLLGMSSLVAMVGGLAVNRQRAAAMVSATKEAEDLAHVVSFLLLSDSNNTSGFAQDIVIKLHQTQGRDAVLVDANQRILADAVPSEIGRTFDYDPLDEIGATIKDRQARTFVEVSPDYPEGIKQIVVPLEGKSGNVIGAVILEYTPVYNELVNLTSTTIRQIVLAGFLSVAIAVLIAFYMGRSIAGPLQQLTDVAAGLAAGRTDVPMPPPRHDEIGQLSAAFTNMVAKRQAAEDDLRRMHGELDVRVVERTAELATANDALREENAERTRSEQALLESEGRTKAIVQSSLDCIVTIDHDGRILEFNPAAEVVFGVPRAHALGMELAELVIPPALRDQHRQGLTHYLATGEARLLGKRVEIVAMRADGREFPAELAITRMGAGEPPNFTGFIRDISERKRAERQLQIQYAISRILAESSTLKRASGRILQAVCESLDWSVGTFWKVDRLTGVMQFDDMWVAPHADGEELLAVNRRTTFARGVGLPGRVWESRRPLWVPDVAADAAFTRADVARVTGLHGALSFPILAGNEVAGVVEFFSLEIREPDEELLNTFAVLGSQLGQFFERKGLQDQLIQSQKMETVGRLAGGIAHEFNSIMTVIIGQSELLLGGLAAGSPPAKSVTEISLAATRAAALTRQLLAYGRKQVLRPEAVNLNRVLASMEGMLHEVMGGDVDLRIIPAAGLKAVKADAGQIEQLIMNLAINARDAMPHAGRLTLETAAVALDKGYDTRLPELAGHYVTLAITDTGVGMSEDVKARIFEPFFTTKIVGQGSGLGLSTCYGIVKQSGGHISVDSEPGHGTTFTIYLPQVEQPVEGPVQRLDSPDLPRGTETLLLVEDDAVMCEMTATLLRRLGYVVVTAANGIEALNLTQQADIGPVDVWLIDVVAPDMAGEALSERVRTLYPRSQILLASAYTANASVHQGGLDETVMRLHKPFTPGALARKLRAMLDQPIAPKPDLVGPA